MSYNELLQMAEDLAFAILEYGDDTQRRDFAPIYHLASMSMTKISLATAMMLPEEEEVIQ
jgi:hypothetical protein